MMRYSFLDNWTKQPNLANLGNDSCKANHPRGPIYYLSFIIYHLLFVLTLAGCSHSATIPTSFTETSDSLVIYPDYRDVTIPPNIAPLNFMITDSIATEYVVSVGDLVCGAGKDGKIDMDSVAWRKTLTEAKGGSLVVNVYARRSNGWVHYVPFTLYVAEEEIDPYLTYRLIEPGYEVYFQLGIYERNLTNFNVKTIYENDRDIKAGQSHCINCHQFQNYDTQRMYLHVRENHGGTIVTQGKEAHKIIIKHDSIIASGAYGGWHPTLPLVAFSSNKTAQFFHYHFPEKIEVYDGVSDIILYDAEHNTVRNICHTSDYFETFPTWSADGTRLYYCVARLPKFDYEQGNYNDYEANLVMRYDSLLYDLYSLPFDTVTYTFGEPRLEVEASAEKRSASVPRISPDGRYLLYALARCGQFHLYHKDADLWVKDLTKEYDSEKPSVNSYPLTATNSPDVDSYHAWSSNGRWMVISSRRDDGDFTRTYIAYFDKQGQGHRAFLLPQRDPEYNLLLLKSFNVPELTKNPVQISTEQFKHIIYHTEADLATFEE